MSDQANANTRDSAHAQDRRAAAVWLTTADQAALLQQQAPLPFGAAGHGCPDIVLDESRSYQPVEGFGFTLTGGSAWLINRLPAADKQALLAELFLPEGIGTSCLRVSVGASDLSERSFSYDDLPPGSTDEALARFDLAAGDADVVPLLKEILALNPALRIIASPWSAPPWMKSNGGFVGGSLKPECYPVYARYLVKYLQAMDAQGVRVHALTPQNEPLHPANEPSMLMQAGEQAEFIKNHLGPALRAAGLEGVELFCWDHNCDRQDYPLAVLADPDARQFIRGVAWHLYAGDIAALSDVRLAHPDMKMYLTEQWVGAGGEFAGDLRWHLKNVLIGSLRNWGRAVLEWNLASAPYYDPVRGETRQGPHTPGGCAQCLGALSIAGGGVGRNVAYYVIAHAAKFVRPGATRIFSSLPDALPNAAFKTPGGGLALIVLNDSEDWQRFNIRVGGLAAPAALPAGAAATYVWPPA